MDQFSVGGVDQFSIGGNIVADRGLFSEENLKLLEENNFKYIVGARIKNISNRLKSKILDATHYTHSKNNEEQKTAVFEFGDHRKLIVNYSATRARKDSYDREKAIKKLIKRLSKSKDPKSLLNNYGYKKYISMQGEVKISINEEKLEAEKQWDGLMGLVTNIESMQPEDILSHYRSLWQIEECFRINKHDLKMRPIYHWSPDRVRAHIGISFMAFVCVRYLEYRLSVQSQKISPELIRQSLMQVQGSLIKDKKTEQSYMIPSKINPRAREIYRIFRVPIPKRIIHLKRSA